jgi:hypothetical protein
MIIAGTGFHAKKYVTITGIDISVAKATAT